MVLLVLTAILAGCFWLIHLVKAFHVRDQGDIADVLCYSFVIFTLILCIQGVRD